jgi:hypothetical protein
MWILCGEKEGGRPSIEQLVKELTEAGNKPEYFTVVKGQGHSYKGVEQDQMLSFFAKHVNAHPPMPHSHMVAVHGVGDDRLAELYVNGRCIELNSGAGLARVNDGTNVIAAHVINHCWSGGFGFTLTLPDGRPLVSDVSWKCNTHLENDWYASNFNDAGWPQAQAICLFSKYQKATSYALNHYAPYFDSEAQFLGPASPQYYRQKFESEGGDASLVISGTGFMHKFWLNGNLINQGDFTKSVLKAQGNTGIFGLETIPCHAHKGRNVLAIQITSVQPDGFGCLWKCGLFYPGIDGSLDCVASGEGWRTSSQLSSGWTDTNYDDQMWQLTTAATYINSAYDSTSKPTGNGIFSAFWLSPGDMYFRKIFSFPQSDGN